MCLNGGQLTREISTKGLQHQTKKWLMQISEQSNSRMCRHCQYIFKMKSNNVFVLPIEVYFKNISRLTKNISSLKKFFLSQVRCSLRCGGNGGSEDHGSRYRVSVLMLCHVVNIPVIDYTQPRNIWIWNTASQLLTKCFTDYKYRLSRNIEYNILF